jgi:hypothetical protein
MTRGFFVATVSGGQRASDGSSGDGRIRIDALTPAEAHALSRSAPLTPAQFKEHRRRAERRSLPLHVLLDGVARGSARRYDARA